MARERLPRRRMRRASITLVALCMTTALGIALGSYLALCTRSTQFSTRMLQQEKVRELAQVGFEEALWALNQNNWTSSGPTGSIGWSVSGANRTVTLSYPMEGQGGVTGQVVLTVANYASTGPTWPTITAAATLTLPNGETFTRSQQATTGPAPLFANAIASADSYVSFAVGGTIDSWNSDPDNDSTTPLVSYSFTSGNAANYEAVIAGRTNGSYGVVLSQATLRGYAATFGLPVSYSTSGSPPGKILGPSTASGVNVDTRRIGKSAFVPLANVFSVTLPTVTNPSGELTLLGGVLALLDTLLDSLLGSSSTIDTVRLNGNFTLKRELIITRPTKIIVDGDFEFSTYAGILGIGATRGKITIQPGASLELYVTGDVNIAVDGFDNQTNDPKKLALFCTGTSTTDSLRYDSAKSFCGVIFCENKPIEVLQPATFYGALLSRQFIRFSASAPAPIFHYDSSLRYTRFTGVTTPYILRQVADL